MSNVETRILIRPCDVPRCLMCSGEACNLCGVGGRIMMEATECEHDVIERHHEPDVAGFRQVVEDARAARREAEGAQAEAEAELRARARRDAYERLTPTERFLVDDIAADSTYGTARFSLDWGRVLIDCGTPEAKNALRSALRKLVGLDDGGA